ncbi:MAG TPA: nucleotide sugar dehydrogenase [Rhizomicrobium sp.]|jgi:UDP-N-acetyl-D-glucosamine dehydrogenase|nr:nucleotide sugar dehydrogenase [Rhizomicrobium sp.]
MTSQSITQLASGLKAKLTGRTGTLGVIGMGYVGLPLAVAAHRAGFNVLGFDVDPAKVTNINSGKSPIRSVAAEKVAGMVASGRFRVTADYAEIEKVDAVMICVPTPLTEHRDPDLSFIEETGRSIARYLRAGQLVVLESTTYPGTTQDVLRPILETGGLKTNSDYFLAYSPEREDPGNANFETASIPRIVGADDETAAELAVALYSQIVSNVMLVSSAATAEAVKLTENIFRSVNIALVNELKIIYARMGINVWEVIEGAKTKPFGFMAFYPGPGLGGHCIPIDPFYLSWKAREYDVATRFIELAGEVNAMAPQYVIDALIEALSRRSRKSLNGSRILIAGLAYKKNVDDLRESPSLRIIELLEARGAEVEFYDPFIPVIPMTREHAALAGRRSIDWNRQNLTRFDAVMITTDHDEVSYQEMVDWSQLVVDTRNATAAVAGGRDKIVLA